MFGYEMSWASFNVIEVMSSPKFAHKRLAYLVAAQSFTPDTDVLMLATNLIKKVWQRSRRAPPLAVCAGAHSQRRRRTPRACGPAPRARPPGYELEQLP